MVERYEELHQREPDLSEKAQLQLMPKSSGSILEFLVKNGFIGPAGLLSKNASEEMTKNKSSFKGQSAVLEGEDRAKNLRNPGRGIAFGQIVPTPENASEYKGMRTLDFAGNEIFSDGENWILDPSSIKEYRRPQAFSSKQPR